jgi:hypothetical protein
MRIGRMPDSEFLNVFRFFEQHTFLIWINIDFYL